VASRAQLGRLGFSSVAIESWLASGRLVPLFHHVYGFSRDIESTSSAWQAALLVGGPASVLSGRSACELWGLVRADGTIPRQIEVASTTRTASSFTGRSPALSRTRVRVVRRALDEGECRRQSGLATTSAARALVDYSVEADPMRLKFAFLEACRLGHVRGQDINYCFRRIEGRRGASKLRPLLTLWLPELGRTRSVLEGMFLLAWVTTGLPVPLVNSKLFGFEVDCHWPDRHLVVELDGTSFHNDPLANARDRERDRILRREGYRVLRFDYPEVKDRPEVVVADVAKALQEPRDPRNRG